ncbi:MAG TPA: phosphate signaling complex protein PhoU [Vicinamibacterales bacterium]|nr:phosphate signaling complex protein PhoU [Vicinamibacterales bacterium]
MKKFDSELAALKSQLLDMGRLAESMAADSSAALLTADAAAIARVRRDEPTLDRYQVDIDREAIRLITVYAPVARDLRCLLMVARINSELERIGDEAIDNCRWLETLEPQALSTPLAGLAEISSNSLQMLRGALEAFEREDIDKAQATIAMDDRIDALESQMFGDLVRRHHVAPELAVPTIGLVLVSRSFERMADHATNICEEVFYWLEGEDIRHR